LRVTAASDADLYAGNNDATVATISSGGLAKYHNDQVSTIGTVDGQSGITAGAHVMLLTSGHMTVAQPVSAGLTLAEEGTGTFTWTADAHALGAITSTAGTTTDLGNVTFDSQANGIGL